MLSSAQLLWASQLTCAVHGNPQGVSLSTGQVYLTAQALQRMLRANVRVSMAHLHAECACALPPAAQQLKHNMTLVAPAVQQRCAAAADGAALCQHAGAAGRTAGRDRNQHHAAVRQQPVAYPGGT